MLILSTALSTASIISGTIKALRSICSIRERLNMKKNQQDIPLEEEVVLVTDEKISFVAKKTDSSELPPENLGKTRKQLVTFADFSESGESEKIMVVFPDGKVLEIIPDEKSKLFISNGTGKN